MSRRDLLFAGVCAIAVLGLAFYLPPRQFEQADAHSITASNTASTATQPVVTQIDQEFAEYWRDQQVEPAPPANTLTIARRLSLAMTGTVPSLEEIRRLESIPEEHRIDWWLNTILADRRYADYFAERLARAYVGVEQGPFLIYRRRRFVAWLSDCLHENMPYDELVRHLIADEGLWTDNPAVNFLTVTNSDETEGPDEVRLAGRTTRAFLGVRLDCMQCHDDNMGGDWLQSDFHELASFFAPASNSIVGILDKEKEYKFKYLREDQEVTVPSLVPFADELFEPIDGSRREQLAHWITNPQNKAFARAIVNRVWALLFGKPLVHPIDNIPLEGPFPPGMETIAQDFLDNDCDLHRLWRIIAATRVFRLDSQADHEITKQTEVRGAAFPLTRLRPEQVAGGLLQAARLSTIDAHSHVIVRSLRFIEQGDFVKRYGDTGEDEFDTHGGTIPQRLLMLNGDLVKERTKDTMVMNAATRIANVAPNDESAIEATYLAVLTRRPSAEENTYFLNRLQNRKDISRVQFFEDLYWVLLNSAEFSWNH